MKFGNIIEKIQNADEGAKKRWLFILSGLTTIIVVFLWLSYLSFAVPKKEQLKEGVVTETNTEGISEKMANIKKTLVLGFNAVKEKLGRKHYITIDSGSRNFILENIEEIPETKLP